MVTSSRHRRHRGLLAAAVASTRVGDHDDVGAIREQLRPGAERMGRGVDAHRAGRGVARRRDVVRELDRRVLERHLLRDAFLQQQVGGLHARIHMEAPLHREFMQRVIERHQGHALVVRHERRQDDARLDGVLGESEPG